MITFTEAGIYCEAGGFHIDPWLPVESAVVTHAHSDHARPGHGRYLCHRDSVHLLRARLGEHRFEGIGWGEETSCNGVRVSLHPAGHIIGSSQVRIEHRGEVWVVSGDYKTEDDGLSGAFEPVRCHQFVTESTFGLPVYRWRPQRETYAEMRAWAERNRAEGRSSVFRAYSLGKAQRIIDLFRDWEGVLFAHGAVLRMQEALQAAGHAFPRVGRLDGGVPAELRRGCVYVTPAEVAPGGGVSRLLGPHRSAVCSGWMQVRGNRRRGSADAGFALSDHADWDGLLRAVDATGAEKVHATHGFQAAFSRYLREKGVEAGEVRTRFGGEAEEEGMREVDNGNEQTK